MHFVLMRVDRYRNMGMCFRWQLCCYDDSKRKPTNALPVRKNSIEHYGERGGNKSLFEMRAKYQTSNVSVLPGIIKTIV